MIHELSSPEKWLDLYGDILYRYGLSRVRNAEAAEDLVQETLLAGLNAKENYKGQASEQTWLIAILKYKIIDYFRKVTRDENNRLDDFMLTEEDGYFDGAGEWTVTLSTWSMPDKSLQQDQFMKVLEGCIDKLSPQMAQVFMLREFDNMTSDALCELMSISSTNNLWVILSRARVQLKHCLDVNWINQ